MKKFAVILLCLGLLCSCSTGNDKTFSGNSPDGSYVKDKPSAGNYFTYTPVIDIFSPELGESAVFLDFDGKNLYFDTASDKSFIFSFDIENREKENLTNILGFQSEIFLSDGENCYYIKDGTDGIPRLMSKNHSSGEEKELMILENDFAVSNANYSLYKSSGYIIAVKFLENGGTAALFYDFENGKTEYIKDSALSGHESIPTNGWFTYAEKSEDGFHLYAASPKNSESIISGPVSDTEILSSAYNGKTFVWATSEGIFCRSGNENIRVTDAARSFAFLGRNFILWASKDKIGLYRIDSDYHGGFNQFKSAELVFADENAAVFRSGDPGLGEEYISIQMVVGEEALYLKDANDQAPYTIAVDGYLYYCFFEPSGITPTEKQISGKITSARDDGSTVPRRNDQSNDLWFIGRQYAFVDGKLLIENETGKAWYICKKSHALSEMNFD